MKNLVILGAGTAGTTVANRVVEKLPRDWSVTVVDPEAAHLYQPGLLFLPFETNGEAPIRRPRRKTLKPRVHWIPDAVESIDVETRRVHLEEREPIPYDLLVIASGSRTSPEETPGLLGAEWRKSIHDFYTLDGARALRSALREFEGGRLVVDVVEMPIKCPVAPLEFLFLADDYFKKRGMRDKVELVCATPLDGVFTKPVCTRILGSMLTERGVSVETEFSLAEVDAEDRKMRSYDGREVGYDLLVTIPTHKGAPFIEASGLGNELAFVPTDPHTLLTKKNDHIFALGDATDLPSSKAGSVAHFQSEVLEKNLLRAIRGQSLLAEFDGHSNCFIESGNGKALLIDFNYDTEPLPGKFPFPLIGPMPLLKEARRNHWGKLLFKWVYWNGLLPGRPFPVPQRMSMAGKKRPVWSAATSKGESHANA